MKKTTVAVLDEADDFGSKLSWLLFKHEQDNRLFGGPDEYDEFGNLVWRPGMALYQRPNGQPGSQYVRNMVNVYDDPDEADFFGRGYRCEDCETWWIGYDPCWVCGRSVPVARLEKLDLDTEPGMLLPDGEGPFWVGHMARLRSLQPYAIRDAEFAAELQDIASWAFEPVSARLEEMSFEFHRMGESLSGLTTFYMEHDEVPAFLGIDPAAYRPGVPIFISADHLNSINYMDEAQRAHNPRRLSGVDFDGDTVLSGDQPSNGIRLPAELRAAIERGDAHIPTPNIGDFQVRFATDLLGSRIIDRFHAESRRDRANERPVTERRRDYGVS